jgi:hypothetical protein
MASPSPQRVRSWTSCLDACPTRRRAVTGVAASRSGARHAQTPAAHVQPIRPPDWNSATTVTKPLTDGLKKIGVIEGNSPAHIPQPITKRRTVSLRFGSHELAEMNGGRWFHESTFKRCWTKYNSVPHSPKGTNASRLDHSAFLPERIAPWTSSGRFIPEETAKVR